ncbi:MAG: hypothetical protein ABSG63_11820 [Spirochaetia bacterium]|jgi:hypothetical protein
MNERIRALALTMKARLDQETGLFDRLGVEVDRLRESYQAKDWGTSLLIAEGIERSAAAVGAADAARDDAFVHLREALELPEETFFSALLPALPDGERADLEEGWRRLRMSVVRLKTATGRMRYAAEALAGVLNRMVEELFPAMKGKIYSRRGRPTAVTGALLVNRKL